MIRHNDKFDRGEKTNSLQQKTLNKSYGKQRQYEQNKHDDDENNLTIIFFSCNFFCKCFFNNLPVSNVLTFLYSGFFI